MAMFKKTRATDLRLGLDVGKTRRPSEIKNQGSKTSSQFYKPKQEEIKARAKDIKDPNDRKEAQYRKGMLVNAPGVKTEKGKEYVAKLEELTGEKQDKIGSYKEAPGGGTPLAKGTKAPSDEWVKEHRQMQPRDPETGQFEYNNANAKGVKYPSRGKKIPTFVKGNDFDKILKRNEHIIITDEGKTAIARLDMNNFEFTEALVNASENLGFTTRWAVESKKGRKSQKEHELLEQGEKGRIGTRVETGKDYGPEKKSFYEGFNKVFDKSYNKEFTPAEEKAIAAAFSDPSKFKIDVIQYLQQKAYARLNVAQQHRNALSRMNAEKAKAEGKPVTSKMINEARTSKNYYE